MAGIRRFARLALAVLTAVILVPVIGEFFVDLARERGFYEHPSESVEAIMNMVASIGANPTYRLIVIGIGSFAIGFWVDYLLGRWWLPKSADIERTTFVSETVYLPDFLSKDLLLSGKTFERCLIRGPAFIKFQSHCTVLFCSIPHPVARTFVAMSEGSAIFGAVLVTHTTFRQCFFDKVTFIGTLEDAQTISPGLAQSSVEAWMAKFPLRP